MRYKFKCDCGESKTVDIPVSEISNAEIICDKCSKKNEACMEHFNCCS